MKKKKQRPKSAQLMSGIAYTMLIQFFLFSLSLNRKVCMDASVSSQTGWSYSIKDCGYNIHGLLADFKTSVIPGWGIQHLLSVTGLTKVLWTHKSSDWLWRKWVVLLSPSELLGYFLTARTLSNCKFNVLSQAAAFMQPRRFPFVPTLPALPL